MLFLPLGICPSESENESYFDHCYGKHFVSCKFKGCSWSGEIYGPPVTNSMFCAQGYDVPGDCGCVRDNEDESSTWEHENDVEYVKLFVHCQVNGCSWSGEIYEPLGNNGVYGPFVCVLSFHSPRICWYPSGNEYEYNSSTKSDWSGNEYEYNSSTKSDWSGNEYTTPRLNLIGVAMNTNTTPRLNLIGVAMNTNTTPQLNLIVGMHIQFPID